jgi:UDP-N-acetylglucosamine--N-acetylmuramyl-(pentapeptide) pyrophosphoryl-undecaprenol N-acetylglucosamine transferase
VLSIGGYAAGPVCVAARAGKVPVALLEPNCVVGLANRLCSPVAARAYLAFPEVRRRFRRGAALVTGVPLRTGFEPRDYAAGGDALRVLVIGGSLGAITLNHNVPEAIGLLVRESAVPIEVTHQSGHDRQHEVRERYERAGVADRVTLVPFIADVPGALARADVVIERAGASAVSEVCAVGRASVLIPYPFAAGDHQMHNARAMEAAGAAVCMPSEEASPPRIAGVLRLLARDPERRARMAAAARARGRPHAARVIARDLLRLAGGA